VTAMMTYVVTFNSIRLEEQAGKIEIANVEQTETMERC
jgi:hypothetical protein